MKYIFLFLILISISGLALAETLEEHIKKLKDAPESMLLEDLKEGSVIIVTRKIELEKQGRKSYFTNGSRDDDTSPGSWPGWCVIIMQRDGKGPRHFAPGRRLAITKAENLPGVISNLEEVVGSKISFMKESPPAENSTTPSPSGPSPTVIPSKNGESPTTEFSPEQDSAADRIVCAPMPSKKIIPLNVGFLKKALGNKIRVLVPPPPPSVETKLEPRKELNRVI